ncbi:MAG TPA: DUF4167 domain-containing protein [Hyphomonadaceae bacterium]|nr:DUF4167 domain-containing protein [Hyphomonadaceae bacterium]
MKRQRGRGRKPGGGGGNHGNRPLESNGPEVKIRGTAAQIYEKYSQYARDAQSSGDRVKYENYLQHAEHYFRIMVATMPRERLFQQQHGEGGLPMQTQGQPGAEGGQPMPAEGGVPGDVSGDAMKVMDDQQGDDDGDYDDADRAEAEGGDEDRGGGDVDAGGADDSGDEGGQQQGERQGRRRRRGRRRHHEGDRNSNQNAGGQNNGNGGSDGGNESREQPRSALDSLARRQGAIAGG